MISEGIYPNLSNEEYHGDKASLSRSSIKDFYESPYYYYAMHLNPNRPPRETSKEMMLGSAFHSFVLEPETFNELYAVKPPRVLLKDVGRELYDAYNLECESLEASKKIVLSSEQYEQLQAMAEALTREPRARQLLKQGEIEKSFFWKDPDTDLMIKARPDVLHHNMIVDLKTIKSASPYAFQRAMVDGWYHVQGAMIADAVKTLEGREITTVINICVEKEYPYLIGVYIIDEDAIKAGREKYKTTLLHMKSCIIENTFKDYPIQTISLPAWAI